jgi:hypothetical protein
MGNSVASASLDDIDASDVLSADSPDNDEQVLFTEAETFVYRVGARASAQGFAASSWGLDEPALTANLRVTAFGGLLCVALWRKHSSSPAPAAQHPSPLQQRYPLTLLPLSSGHALVALCKVPLSKPPQTPPLSYFMEPTIDSSRYFVLRCTPPPGQAPTDPSSSLLVGFGFRHREAAFQLKACISDHIKSHERQAVGAQQREQQQQQQQQQAGSEGAAGEAPEDEDAFGDLTAAPPPPKISLAAKSVPLLPPPP